VRDSVVENETGIFFDEPEVSALAGALEAVERRVWGRSRIRARAAEFTRGRFAREFSEALLETTGTGRR
jgi:hypothetical protein